jgi:NAD(P)-dependent dehydrogenase (short-subunit alcohol dehydrogenase family)
MPSSHWDEQLAARYRAFQYNFEERTLAGKLIVVAGGTGGLGAATVALLASEGARLIVGYRTNRDRAESLQRAIREQLQQEITLVKGDLLGSEVRRAFVTAIEAAGAPLAGAVIFPGDPARVSWEQLDSAALEESYLRNFVAPILLAKDLGERMQKSEAGGSLVLLGTMQAVAPFAGSLNYAAPKAALVHAARILAKQWKRVRVNVVAPGATVAGMAEASVSSGKYDAFVAEGKVQRFGRPEDIARAVRFFLEPDGYATGQVLVLDGGLTL